MNGVLGGLIGPCLYSGRNVELDTSLDCQPISLFRHTLASWTHQHLLTQNIIVESHHFLVPF